MTFCSALRTETRVRKGGCLTLSLHLLLGVQLIESQSQGAGTIGHLLRLRLSLMRRKAIHSTDCSNQASVVNDQVNGPEKIESANDLGCRRTGEM